MFRKLEKGKGTAHAAGCYWELGEKAGQTVGSVQGGSSESLGAMAVARALGA